MAHTFDPTAAIPADTLKAASKLQSHELKWKAASKFLKSNGYYLPERYQESWSPSWGDGNKIPSQCPDFRCLSVRATLFIVSSVHSQIATAPGRHH